MLHVCACGSNTYTKEAVSHFPSCFKILLISNYSVCVLRTLALRVSRSINTLFMYAFLKIICTLLFSPEWMLSGFSPSPFYPPNHHPVVQVRLRGNYSLKSSSQLPKRRGDLTVGLPVPSLTTTALKLPAWQGRRQVRSHTWLVPLSSSQRRSKGIQWRHTSDWPIALYMTQYEIWMSSSRRR